MTARPTTRSTVLALAGMALSGVGLAASAADKPSRPGVDALALYAQGSAVVQDSRTLDLKQGTQTINWPVPGVVQADTLWLSSPGVQLSGFQISQTASNGSGPLAARINTPVTLTDASGNTREGRLVALEGEMAYVKIGDTIERITPYSFSQISWQGSADGVDAPAPSTLALDLSATAPGKRDVTATYQMDAPSWQASYTGRFDASNNVLLLQANAVVDNSGRGALNADKAWLVAGDVSRASNNGSRPPMAMMARSKSASDSVGGPEASGSGYRYPLAQGLHVPANVTRALPLMAPVQLKAMRDYRFDHYALAETGEARDHAKMALAFTNSSDGPLPAGAVRIYDASGAPRLMGGTQMNDTPKDAPVRLTLGEAFDITGTHQVVDKSSSEAKSRSRTVKVVLYNAADKAQNVVIQEQLPNAATLASNSPKTSGGTASQPQWTVNVPAGGQQSLTYSLTMPATQ